VPWLALLSLALLVGGLTIFAIKGKPAADAADALLLALDSPSDEGFPLYMSIYSSSVWATVGVAGAAVALLLLAASVRLDQKLRRAGKYADKNKGEAGAGRWGAGAWGGWPAQAGRLPVRAGRGHVCWCWWRGSGVVGAENAGAEATRASAVEVCTMWIVGSTMAHARLLCSW